VKKAEICKFVLYINPWKVSNYTSATLIRSRSKKYIVNVYLKCDFIEKLCSSQKKKELQGNYKEK
jgi:hypothetical protein